MSVVIVISFTFNIEFNILGFQSVCETFSWAQHRPICLYAYI